MTNPNIDPNITQRNICTVGRFVAPQVRSAIRQAAFQLGLSLILDEERGLIEYLLFVTVSGPQSSVERFWQIVKSLEN